MLLTAILMYLCIGAVFAPIFIFAIAPRGDHASRIAPLLVRTMWLPAAALLWPPLALRALTPTEHK